ncbi:hypothetical protein Emag_005186 [Eimeria magna]
MAGAVSQLSLAGGPPQSIAPDAGVEKAPDSVRLLHPSGEETSMSRQARHRVSHRTLLGAASSYVAILAVALLILVCARRLSNMSVEERRVRSLAGAGGHEPAGACGSNAEGEREEESHEESAAWQETVIQQARQNIESFRELLKLLVELKSASAAKALRAATSCYLLLLAEMGLLGGFVETELRSIAPLWHQLMQQAIDSSVQLETGRQFSDSGHGPPEIHEMNGDLLELIGTIEMAKRKRTMRLGVNRWAVLQRLVQVQAFTVSIACRYLYIIHPASEATRGPRRQALSGLAAMTDARRLMLLAEEPFAAYFESFFTRGLARQRFGPSCGRIARGAKPPLDPDDQIFYLLENFFEDLSPQPRETAVAYPIPSPPAVTPSSEQKGPTMQTQTPPMHRQDPPMQPPWPPLQPPGPLLASGSQSPSPSALVATRPKLYSEVAASAAQKSGGSPSKQPPPGDLEGAWPSLPSPSRAMNQLQVSAPGHPPHSPNATRDNWNVGPRLRQQKALKAKGLAPNDVASSGKKEALLGPWAGAEGGFAEEPQALVGDFDLAQALAALSVAEEEGSTADVEDEAEEMFELLDSSASHASQAVHVPLPSQGHSPFSFAPWAAPGTPMGNQMPGVRPPSSPTAGAFFGFPQGAPKPTFPLTGPSLPPGFWEPKRSAGLAGLKVLRPPGFPEAPPLSPFLEPSPPPGFAVGSRFGGFAKQSLQRPSGPFGPLPPTSKGPPTSGDPFYGPLHGALQDPPPRSPQAPFRKRLSRPFPLSPSQPRTGGLPHVAPAAKSMQGPPHVSPLVPSVLGPLAPLFGAPSIWSPLPSSDSIPFSSWPQHLSPLQPSVSGPSPLGLSSLAVFGLSSTDTSSDEDESESPLVGVFHGAPMGEPTPSSTSVATAAPPK